MKSLKLHNKDKNHGSARVKTVVSIVEKNRPMETTKTVDISLQLPRYITVHKMLHQPPPTPQKLTKSFLILFSFLQFKHERRTTTKKYVEN